MDVNRTEIVMTLLTNQESRLIESVTNNAFNWFFVCFSHLHHDFAVSFFNSQVGINSWKKVIERFSGKIGLVYHSSRKMLSTFRDNFFPKRNSQAFLNPLHDAKINGCEFENSSMHNWKGAAFCFDSVNVKTSVSINISSQIGKIDFIHNVYSISTVYKKDGIKSTVNDLSGQTPKGEAKVWPLWKHREADPKRLARLAIGHKVTDRRVYATYIVLTRQVTITNEDPKQYGVYKSSLIDFKLLAA